MTAPHVTAEQQATAGRLIQRGFAVVSQGSDGSIVLARGSEYRVSRWDM